MVHPKCYLPATEMLLSESPVVSNRSWQNSKENSLISDSNLQKLIHDVGKRRIGNEIQTKCAQRYAHRSIQIVNREEEESEGQKRKTRTGIIKVLGLIHKRETQSDPRLAWFMVQNIYRMYHNINNKEERDYAMLITSMSEQEEAKNLNE